MEETNIIEQDTSNIQPTESTVVEQPTVVEQVTPMDNNVTYDSVPKEHLQYDTNLDPEQNLAKNIVQVSYDANKQLNNGAAMNRFLNKEYDYDKEEAGSYWVAGGINDKDTQMSFLNTIINEEMYDEMDLQKYYYDSTMATARAYAANKDRETAYGFYRAAQEKAIAEAQLTGWYMPAEGQYMLANYNAAQATLDDPDANSVSKSKAQRVMNVAEQWFSANKISTRGMKCLSMMNYEENVRHNTIMGQLKKEANQIAGAGNAANSRLADLNLRIFKWQVEEAELDHGYNFTKKIGLSDDDYIGHDINEPEYQNYQALKGYGSLSEALSDPEIYNSVRTTYGIDYMKRLLNSIGKDANEYEVMYKSDSNLSSAKSYLNDHPETTTLPVESGIVEKQNIKIKINGNQDADVYIGIVNGKIFAGTYEDGVWVPVTDGGKKILGKDLTIDEYIDNKYGEYGKEHKDYSGINSVIVDGKTYHLGRDATNKSATGITTLTTSTNEGGLGWIGRFWMSNDQHTEGYNRYNLNHDKTENGMPGSIQTMQKTNEYIRKATSEEGLKEKGSDKVQKNLEIMDGWMDQDNVNQYVILRDPEHDNWYRLNDDGTLSYIKPGQKKDLKHYSADKLKVGDSVTLTGNEFGDNTSERIVKSSYMVSTLEHKGKQYITMCYIDKDKQGNVQGYHYYELVSTGLVDTKNSTSAEWKVNKTNLTEQDVINRGGTPIPTTETKQEDIAATAEYSDLYNKKYEHAERQVEPNSANGADGTNNNPTYDAATTDVDKATFDKQESNQDSGANLLEQMGEFEKKQREKDPEKYRTINKVKEG